MVSYKSLAEIVFVLAVPVALVVPDVPYGADCVKACMGESTFNEGDREVWESRFEQFYETPTGGSLEQEFSGGGVWESEWEEAGQMWRDWMGDNGYPIPGGGTTATNWVKCRMRCTSW